MHIQVYSYKMAWHGTCLQKVHTELSTAALQLIVKLIEAHFRWNIKVSLCIWSLDIIEIVHIVCTCRLLQLWGRWSWINLQWYQLCHHLSWLLKVNLWYMFIIVAQYYCIAVAGLNFWKVVFMHGGETGCFTLKDLDKDGDKPRKHSEWDCVKVVLFLIQNLLIKVIITY